jgi:hypothetical protein
LNVAGDSQCQDWPALIFQRLWQAYSIDRALMALLKDCRFEFSVKRAIFLTVLHRLFALLT